MKKFLIAAALVFVGLGVARCSSSDKVRESSASENQESAPENQENLNRTFTTLLNSEDPQTTFLNYLTRHNNLFFSSQEYLASFDRKLKEADDAVRAGKNFEEIQELWPMRDPSYKKLLASRVLQERFREKISYMYLELLKLAAYVPALDQSPPDERKEKQRLSKISKNILGAYNKHLRTLKRSGSTDKIAVQILVDSSLEAIRSFNADRRRQRALGRVADGLPVALPTTTSVQMFASNNELVRFVQQSQPAIAEASAKEAARLSADDKANIDNAMTDIDFVMQERVGNITGSSLPQGTWAITFDDGPSNKYTSEILKVAATYNIPCTFFWLAKNMMAYPEAVGAAYKAHMPIGGHSHKALDHELTDAINYIKRTLDGLNNDIAVDPSLKQTLQFFRLSNGAGFGEQRLRQRLSSKNLVHVFWNIDSLDWQDKNPDSILQRVAMQMRLEKKGIILFHDVYPQSSAAFMKLAQMIKDKPTELSAVPIRLVSIPAVTDEMNREKK